MSYDPTKDLLAATNGCAVGTYAESRVDQKRAELGYEACRQLATEFQRLQKQRDAMLVAATALIRTINKVQDWSGTHVQDAMDDLDTAIAAAKENP